MGVPNTALLGSEGPSNEMSLFQLNCNKLPFWIDPFKKHCYFHSKRCTDYINRKLSSDKKMFEKKSLKKASDEADGFEYYSNEASGIII
jgi:hypothetical protein